MTIVGILKEAGVIKVLKMDEVWLAQIALKPMILQVHSIFLRAINLVDKEDKLYTIAAKQVEAAPDTVVLDCLNLSDLSVSIGEQVFCNASQISFEKAKFKIALNNVPIWQANLPCYRKIDYAYVDELCEQVLLNHAAQSGSTAQSEFERLSYALIEAQTNILLDAVKRHDHQDFLKTLTRYFGLGIGLTPSGDDFILGVSATLSVLENPAHEYYLLCQEAIYHAKPLTNLISYAALENASRGRFNAHILHVLEHIFDLNNDLNLDNCVEEERLNASLRQLLRIGSSSGADILRGLRFGLLLIDFAQNACQ